MLMAELGADRVQRHSGHRGRDAAELAGRLVRGRLRRLAPVDLGHGRRTCGRAADVGQPGRRWTARASPRARSARSVRASEPRARRPASASSAAPEGAGQEQSTGSSERTGTPRGRRADGSRSTSEPSTTSRCFDSSSPRPRRAARRTGLRACDRRRGARHGALRAGRVDGGRPERRDRAREPVDGACATSGSTRLGPVARRGARSRYSRRSRKRRNEAYTAAGSSFSLPPGGFRENGSLHSPRRAGGCLRALAPAAAATPTGGSSKQIKVMQRQVKVLQGQVEAPCGHARGAGHLRECARLLRLLHGCDRGRFPGNLGDHRCTQRPSGGRTSIPSRRPSPTR